MNKSESIKNIGVALAAFQGEIANPSNTKSVDVKTRTGGTYSYSYASLGEILTLVRPLLAKNGLSILQPPGTENGNVSVTTILIHTSGEWIEFDPITIKPDGAGAQAIGSAITYARRYGISAICGIASEDDDDGNLADGNEIKTAGKKSTARTISKEDAAQLFEAANGDNEVVRQVLDVFGYKKSTDVPISRFKDVKNTIKATFKEKLESYPTPFD